MIPESSESDSHLPNTPTRRVNNNQMMLDLRHQVQHQERIIRGLVAERDTLTRELDSRLFLVEAQLRREQKHIEAVLGDKEHIIQFQAMQIHSLKQLLSQVSQAPSQRNYRSSKRMLSKRYSVALDEYMKDHCVVSRALPVMVKGENDRETSKHSRCSRTRSLPELRFKVLAAKQECSCQSMQSTPDANQQQWCHRPPADASGNSEIPPECCRMLSQDVMDEISKRWTSDCESEHSDSLDSGISSPSIKSRNMHDEFNFPTQDAQSEKYATHSRRNTIGNTSSNAGNRYVHDAAKSEFENHVVLNQKPKRSSSIGNFINRTFSSSSSPEKIKDNQEVSTRRHSSFSGNEAKDLEVNTPQKARFISSANRTFGTNHRSVTKPRDIKFRKLFKFRRRTEPETVNGEDYMTV